MERILDIIKDEKKEYLAALMNNSIKNLNTLVNEDDEYKLLKIDDYLGSIVYNATLRFIIAYATKRAFKNAKISFSVSVSRSYFAYIFKDDKLLDPKDYQILKKEVKKIIDEDIPIIPKLVKKSDLIEYMKKNNQLDKIDIYDQIDLEYIPVHSCNDFKDSLYTELAPSTVYIKKYSIIRYKIVILVSYPRIELGSEIPPIKEEVNYLKALKESIYWTINTDTLFISDLNNLVKNGRAIELINICEARHNSQFVHLADKILKNKDIKLVCIAGPSSSGKTTFTNRLKIELKSRGLRPILLSLDDFYKTYDMDYPKDRFGLDDHEHIESIDVDLFNKTIKNLLDGKETYIPKFNFKNRTRSFNEKIKINSTQLILVEGLHGLNPVIASSIPKELRFNVYIAPIGGDRVDDHTPISLSDIRLIRRLVRDYNTRNFSTEETILVWDKVREGEYKWVYPYQKYADYVFNSELRYELSVLKKYALPLLASVPETSKAYIRALGLTYLLKYHIDIDDKWVPNNSILREFIGKSIFYEKELDKK